MPHRVSTRPGLFILGMAIFLGGGAGACRPGDDDEQGAAGTGGAEGQVPRSVETRCHDAAGQPLAPCAVEPEGARCALGDAGHCAYPAVEEVFADDGAHGVCLRLILRNECDVTAHAETCIEHAEDGAPGWVCWTTRLHPDGTAEVGACRASGRYRHAASTSEDGLAAAVEGCWPP